MSTTVSANERTTTGVCRPQKNLRLSECAAYLRRGCFRGPFRGQLRGPFRGHRFRILTGMRCTTTCAAEDGYFRALRNSEKSLAAEVFAEDTVEDEGAHSPAWQRVRGNVESATSR